MRGTVDWQVREVFKTVDKIGTSKHDAKIEVRNNGATSWHEVGKELGVHSYATADAYRDVWRHACEYAKAEYDLKNIEKITEREIAGYLESKVRDGVSHATLAQYSAALEKFEVALNRYAAEHDTGREYNFHESIQDVKDGANLERFEGSRAYVDPDRLVAEVHGDKYSIAAALQREGGARISEANHISLGQLHGIRPDASTGEQKGWIEVEGKGGKVREIGVSPETYNRVSREISEAGRFDFDKRGYARAVEDAAERSGQNHQGTHGLRWSWAQERHAELQKHGRTYEQALGLVSAELGHDRADITEHYLR